MKTVLPARLDLALECAGGVTRPVRALAQPPLQLSRVRYDTPEHPAQANFTLLHLGGVLAGDQNQLTVALGERAEAQIVGAAATQIYTMPQASASQHLTLRLAAGSRLAWLAAPTILFAGANFSQTVRVELAAGAVLTYLDVLVPGRLARGEVFAFERYTSRFEVYDDCGMLLVAERAVLEPRRHTLTAPGLFAEAPVVGSLFVLGAGNAPERHIRAYDPEIATAELPNNAGVLIRATGITASAVHQRLVNLYQAAGEASA